MSPNHENGKSATVKAKTRAYNLFAYGQDRLDRIVPPSTREEVVDSISTFANKRPLLSLLLATNILLALLPTVLFAGFFLTALFIALLSALAFILFWTGIALLFFVPTLFLTAGLSILVWLWAVGTYIVGRSIYNRLPLRLRVTEDKKVIFHRDASGNHGNGDGFEAIKAEVAEARD
ncbi:hypothetical protein GGR50DRAFT_69753 [Xylaria sp. CBS 124048]|nr:hypothetical protein GGR50DRAFT_69753 [Xylaria sp. CBS 124048]